MSRRVHTCTDRSKTVEVIRRQDAQGNVSGGLILHEGFRHETATFEQAKLRGLVEDLAEVAGVRKIEWGFERQENLE